MPEFNPLDTQDIRARLAAFICRKVDGIVRVGALRRFTVGVSWVTYGVRAQWSQGGREMVRELVLRVGPPNGIFAPYRAEPEFITLKALAGSGVPVPQVFWFSDDVGILGAPFIISQLVPGEAPIPWTHDGSPAFDEAERIRIGRQFVEALAALHRFKWQGTEVERLDGSKDPQCTALAQIDYWEANLAKWSARRIPMLELAAQWLRKHAPVAERVSIVHGDYRIGNFLVAKGDITAILDWEIVRLGDPVEDLGFICMQAWRGKQPYMCHLLTREELRESYVALTGMDVSLASMRYWEAFGTYKLAVMHYGATHCFEKRGFNDLRMAGMGAQIPRMLLQVESAMERAA